MINHVTRQLLTRIGVFPGKTTKAADLASLVRDMRVVPIGQDLLRIGPDGDGGYLVPDELDGIAACFSPGVADCADFELALAERGMAVYLADRSVERPPLQDPRFRFVAKFLASTSSDDQGLVTLDDWVGEELGAAGSAADADLLLQMDIEGAEYEVLHSVSDACLRRFRIIVIEFHRLYQLADRFAFRFMAPAIRKLLRSHAVVHMHPNNYRKTLRMGPIEIPSHLEVTLLRRDRLRPGSGPLRFPHPLDRPCKADRPEAVLPDCWYR